MTIENIVKFPSESDLFGYGFDIGTDRLVRFNKFSDGTYQKTRATYSINEKNFTHYDIRKEALLVFSKVKNNVKSSTPMIKWKWIIGVFALMFIFSASECSVNVNTESVVVEDVN